MDPQILDLAEGRPAGLVPLLREVGVQTFLDIRMIWPSGSQLVQEVEAKHGKLDASQAFSIHAFWTMASGRSHQDATRIVNAVVMDRSSTLRLHAAPEAGEPCRPKVISYRQMITTGALPSPPVLSQAAAADPHAREQANKDRKVDALFHLLLEDVLNLEELGLDAEQIQDPGVVQRLKETVMAQPSQLSATRLGALASSFRRWRKFALPRQISVRYPKPLQLAEFFKEVSRGGQLPQRHCGSPCGGSKRRWVSPLVCTTTSSSHTSTCRRITLQSRLLNYNHGSLQTWFCGPESSAEPI